MENGEQREYSIGELAERAGVSTRTIRYYVSEGLLPPPEGGGPNSRYTSAHLDQLEIIGRLKAQYLPLKEIRRRLIGQQPMPKIAPVDARRRMNQATPFAGQSRRTRERAENEAQMFTGASPITRPEMQDSVEFHSLAMPASPKEHPDHEAVWRRVPLTDEAELLITDNQYRRHQDKIDWLVQWVKRVLEP